VNEEMPGDKTADELRSEYERIAALAAQDICDLNAGRVPAPKVRLKRVGGPPRATVKRMDCPSVMREHLWSIEREGIIECLWCFERRRSEDRERPSGAHERDDEARPSNPTKE
jgi:hypothetical protein